ncbi:MAG: PIN domain-containing protein [Solirubrobacterales bacterium]
MLLIDASVWVSSGAPLERFHAESASLIWNRHPELAALDLTLYEVANTVGIKFSQPAEARKLIDTIVTCCTGDRLRGVDPGLLGLAIEIATEHGLSAYDAAYVAAAQRNGWQLVSIDVRDLVSKGLAVTPDAALYP